MKTLLSYLTYFSLSTIFTFFCSQSQAVEFYDLASDPGEHHNLAATRTKERDELLDELLVWMNQTHAVLPQKGNSDYDPQASAENRQEKGNGK